MLRAGAEPVTFETRHRHRDGSLIPVLLRAAPIDPADPLSAKVVTIMDITERLRSEDAMRRGAARVREIFNHTSDVIFSLHVEPNGRCVFDDINDAVERLGVPPAEFRAGNRTPADIFDPATAELLSTQYSRCAEERNTVDIEQVLQMPVGPRTFLTRLVPVTRNGGGRVERIVGFAHDVTEQRSAEAAARASELRLEHLLCNTNDLLITIDRAGVYRSIFGPVEKILGYSASELIGRNGFEMVHPDDHGRAAAVFDQSLATPGATMRVDYRVRHKDGTWVDIETMGTNWLHDPDIHGIVMNCRDITERKRVEESLRLSEARLEAAQEHAHVGSWELDPSIGRGHWSRQLFRLFGMSPGPHAPTFDEFLELVHPEDRDRVKRSFERSRDQARIERFEFRTNPERLGARTFEVAIRTDLTSSPGRLLMSGTLQDVTARVLAAEELREKERRWATLVGNLSGVAYRCGNDPNWTLEFISARCRELLGVTDTDFLLTRRTVLVDIIPPEMRQQVWEEVQRCLSIRSPYQFVYRVHTRTDKETWVSEQGRGIFDEEGNLLALEGVLFDITEQKLTEQALRLSEVRLEAAQAHAQVGSWDLDLSVGYGYWSQQLFRLFNLEPAPTPPSFEAFIALLHPDDRARTAEAFASAARDGSVTCIEFRGDPAQGLDRTYEARIHARRSDDHTVLSGTTQDISGRKAVEESLRLSEARLETAQEHARIGNWDIDLVTNSSFWSKQMFRLVDLELSARPPSMSEFLERVHPEDRDKLRASVVDCSETGEAHSVEYRTNPALCVPRFLEANVRPQRDSTGCVTRLSGILQDITDRKQAEQRLRESESSFRAIFENAIEGIFQSTTDGRFLRVSPSLAHMFGYDTPAEMCATITDIATQIYTTPQQRNLIQSQLERGGSVVNTDVEVRHRDGHTFWVLLNIRTVSDEAGHAVGYEGSSIDITESRRLAELQAAKTQAEVANRAKSAFLANMSHEIRTPMNAILGFTQLLLRDPSVTARQRENLETIDRNGTYLLALLNDVLEISKIEARHATLKLAPCDLRLVARDLRAMFAPRTQARGVAFSIDGVSDLPSRVLADDARIRQILVNLVGNAVKFTEQGRVALRLKAFRENTTRWLIQAEVEDTGPGIAPGEIDRLFRQFEQTSAGQRAGTGTGLGLAISREFARMMEGDITVRSNEGLGSIFTVEVRVGVLAESLEIPRTSAHGRVRSLARGQSPRRILVADDQDDSRRLLCNLLGSVGFEVEAVSNGAEAVAAICRRVADCVIMDFRMPEMDGAEATRRIRALECGGRIRILGLSASVLREVDEPMPGIDDFMGKPFRDDELLERLRQLLDIQYDYEVPEVAPRSAEVPSGVPSAYVSLLRRAFAAADLDSVCTLLEQMQAEEPELAESMRSLANQFAWDALLAMLPSEEKETTP